MANYMDGNEKDEEQSKNRTYKSALRIYKKARHADEEEDSVIPPEPISGTASADKKSPFFASDEEAERLREPGIKEDSFFPPPGATLRDPYKADPKYAAITEGMPGLESIEYGVGAINKMGAADKMATLAAEKAEQKGLSRAALESVASPDKGRLPAAPPRTIKDVKKSAPRQTWTDKQDYDVASGERVIDYSQLKGAPQPDARTIKYSDLSEAPEEVRSIDYAPFKAAEEIKQRMYERQAPVIDYSNKKNIRIRKAKPSGGYEE